MHFDKNSGPYSSIPKLRFRKPRIILIEKRANLNQTRTLSEIVYIYRSEYLNFRHLDRHYLYINYVINVVV